MKIRFKCPHCHRDLEAEPSGAGTLLTCPYCMKEIAVERSKNDMQDERLLDPSDPAGFFANFPPEDDGMT